ncbi:MAG: ABC transporter permease [Thaumarchaeota archaeon]|nr:ABC transporter permease [Nitrososphaerota archaeon]
MRFLIRRLITYLVIIFAAFNINFFLPRVGPANAATILAGAAAFAPAERVLIAQRLGLNQPLLAQYLVNLKDVFATWPPYFGVSYANNAPVATIFAQALPWTLILMISSFFLSLVFAFLATMLIALRRGGKLESGSTYAAISVHSIPIYFTSSILLSVFAVSLKWFPVFGSKSFVTQVGLPLLTSIVSHAVLPVVALSISLFGLDFLLLRGSIQEVLRDEYVIAAKLRGLPNRTIAWGYVLRNSLLPFVSLSAFSVANLVGRLIIVETIFGYPGIGGLVTDGIENKDYPMIMGVFMLLTFMVIIGGLIGDVVLTRLDPRLRRD